MLHVVTLALGLIIAFGLQQIVALFQRRSREKDRKREQKRQATTSAQEPKPVDSEPPLHE